MKMIETVIQQGKLQEVTSALDGIGIVDFMVTPILCYGGSGKRTVAFRGAEFVANVAQKVKLEVISSDYSVARVIEAIASIIKTGRRDDCRIAIRPYEEVA